MNIRHSVWTLMLAWLLAVAAAAAETLGDDDRDRRDNLCMSGLRVATFAGPALGGEAPSGFADGWWSDARFNTPTYVLSYLGTNTNPVNGLLLSDTGNHVIRVIRNGLEVQTLAGTPK